MTDRAWLFLDRVCRRLKRYLGDADAWKEEVCEWAGFDPATWDEVWSDLRRDAEYVWLCCKGTSPDDWSSYYHQPYFALRGAWYRRHDTFYTILRTMGEEGRLLDYGCGVGTVGLWLMARRPGWQMVFADLPTPAQDFLKWRLRHRGYVPPDDPLTVPHVMTPEAALRGETAYDTILCLDTFEHLPKPHDTLEALLTRLKPGGHLFCSMSPDTEHENIGGKYLPEVLAVLDRTCEERLGMTDTNLYGHYVKRMDAAAPETAIADTRTLPKGTLFP